MHCKEASEGQPYMLYIDDDTDDLELIGDTIKEINPSANFCYCLSGEEAFSFLESLNKGDVLPAIIIVDLNMPGWDGLRMLNAIKSSSAYQQIPVCIFTNSDHPRHIASSLAAGAFEYLKKPYKREELLKVCRLFERYIHQPLLLK